MEGVQFFSIVLLISLHLVGVYSFPLSVDDYDAAPDTVKDLDLNAYLGRWYQTYADLVVFSTFESHAQCVTADYGLKTNTTISVLNANTMYSPKGAINKITGVAYIPDPNKPGQLKVDLDGVPLPGDYWIIQLGPKEGSPPLYRYSVVTDPNRITLFVLARDVTEFKERFEASVLNFLAANGFDKIYNKPKPTVQVATCNYVDPPKQ